MIWGRRVTAASGSPPAMPLAVVTMSGTTPSCSQANQSPVRQNPVWISSAMNTIPCPRQEPVGRYHETAFALDRLDDHGGHVVLADLGVDQALDHGQRVRRAHLAAA